MAFQAEVPQKSFWMSLSLSPSINCQQCLILWGEEAQHNERAEWIRREQKRKISHMDWRPIEITEIT
jgi:hypothetical protein